MTAPLHKNQILLKVYDPKTRAIITTDGIYTQITEVVSSVLTYVGMALYPGAEVDTSLPIWRIKRIVQVGTQQTITYADTGTFDQVWDDRATLFPIPVFTNTYSTLFDGINDYVNFGNTVNYDIATQFSIALWFKQNNQASRMNLFSKVTSDANVYGFSLAIETSGRFFTQMRAPAFLPTYTGTTLLVSTGVWNFLVFTYGGGSNINSSRVYLNNVVDSIPTSSAIGASWLASQNFILGNRNTAFPYSGHMDEVSIWSKALSVAEISTLYNAGSPVDPSAQSFSGDLVSYYKMGDGDILGTILDNQGSNNGIMTNFSATVGDVFKADVP